MKKLISQIFSGNFNNAFYIFLIGLTIIFGALLYMGLDFTERKISGSRANLEAIKYRQKIFQSTSKDKFSAFINSVIKSDYKEIEKEPLIGAFLGVALTLSLVSFKGGLTVVSFLFALGILSGYGLGKFWVKIKKDKLYNQKLREMAIISEMMDLFANSGYQINQILRISSNLVHVIKPEIERCLSRWPIGVEKALYNLERELELDEASILISILVYANNIGTENMKRILQEESRNLDAIRKTLTDIRMSSKPMYYALFRVVPFVGAAAVVLVPLVTYVLDMIKIFIGG